MRAPLFESVRAAYPDLDVIRVTPMAAAADVLVLPGCRARGHNAAPKPRQTKTLQSSPTPRGMPTSRY